MSDSLRQAEVGHGARSSCSKTQITTDCSAPHNGQTNRTPEVACVRQPSKTDAAPEAKSLGSDQKQSKNAAMSSLDTLAMACAAEQSTMSFVSPKSIMEEPTKLVTEEKQELAPPFPSKKNVNSDSATNYDGMMSGRPHLVVSSASVPSSLPTAASASGKMSQKPDSNRNLNMLVASATAAIQKEAVAAGQSIVPALGSTKDEGAESFSSAASNGDMSKISRNDVLCGRGGLTNHHPGNIFFRQLVRQRQEMYLRASKRDKASVAKSIVETIRNLDPPGRFLKKKNEASKGAGSVWCEIGNRKAREKTSQALRERAPELREGLMLNDGQAQQQEQSQSSAVPKSPGQRRNFIKRRAYELPVTGKPSHGETEEKGNTQSNQISLVPGIVSRENSTSGYMASSESNENSHGREKDEVKSSKRAFKNDSANRLQRGVMFDESSGTYKRQKTFHQTSAEPSIVPDSPQSTYNSKIVHAISAAEEDIQSSASASNSDISNEDGAKEDDDDEGSKRGPRLKMLKARIQNIS